MLGKVKNFFCNWFNFGNQTQGLKRERDLSSEEPTGNPSVQLNYAPTSKKLKLMAGDPGSRDTNFEGMPQISSPSKRNLEAKDTRFTKPFALQTSTPIGTPAPGDMPKLKPFLFNSNQPESFDPKRSGFHQPLPSIGTQNLQSEEAGSSLSQLENFMEKLGSSTVGTKPKSGIFQLPDPSSQQNHKSKSPANNFTNHSVRSNLPLSSNVGRNPFRLSPHQDFKKNLPNGGLKKINYRPMLQKMYGSPKRRKDKSHYMSMLNKQGQQLAIQNCVRMEEKLSYKALLCQFGTKTGPFPRFSTSTISPTISSASSFNNLHERTDTQAPRPIQPTVEKTANVIELDSDSSITHDKTSGNGGATIQSPARPITRINTLEDALAQSPQYDPRFISNIKSRFNAKERERQRLVEEESIRVKIFSENREEWEKELEERVRKQLAIVKRPVIDERLEEVVVLPEISDEMTKIIEDALHNNRDGDVLCDAFNLTITRRDLKTLDGLNWLNDQIINFYLTMVMERSNSSADWPKVFTFNTFFYPKLMTAGHSGLKRWTRKVDLFEKDFILIPVHLGLHWCLATVCPKERAIRYYDSMGGQNKECLNSLKRYMEAESMDKKKTPLDTSDWTLECVQDIPQQMNGSDCGMFACKYAEYLSRKAKITFNQKDMPYFRRRMVYEIITQKLSHP